MHVKHIILDGFKSYRDRTDIGTFDAHFNAITGLNGSGKSNILDAICFVLGLSSLGVVRAGNLAELVYKGGSGGVTRASASIVFDNKDKTKSPVGFKNFDEIIVSRTVEQTGGCKYYLNSITSTKKQITDLFESIQLNISNPNFMIMQGKITKVINMTPKQILGMIEETVGGTVYQVKRDKTEQEINNKDRCIETTRTLIKEDIYPEWRRQRDARERLQEFQTVEIKTQRASKFYAVLKYKDLKINLENGSIKLNQVLENEIRDEKLVDEHKMEIELCKERQNEMKKKNQDKFKDRIESAEKEMKAEKKSYMTIEAKVNSAKMDITDTNKKLVEAEKAKKQQEKEMADYKTQSANSVEEFEAVKQDIVNAQEQLEKAKEQENALKLGNIVDEEGKTCDARQELMRIDDEINTIQPDFQVGDQQHKEDVQKLRKMEQDLKNTPSNAQVEQDYKTKSDRLKHLKGEARKRNINPDDSAHNIVDQINQNDRRTDLLSKQKQKFMQQNYNLTFEYQKGPTIDDSKILGCVYELMKANNLEEWGGALEVVTGGILGHIVVADEHVAKALLKDGRMQRRTNVHPLSVFKTTNRSNVTQRQLDQRIGVGKAVPVMDLLEYDPAIKDIVQHFLGGKVVCDTIETARKVAFNMGYYAVSKLGDVADPGGTMQGGSRQNLGRLMATCESLREISVELKQLKATTADLKNRYQIAKSNEAFMKDLEIAKRDVQNAEETRKLTSHSMLQKEIQDLKDKLQQDEESLKVTRMQLDTLGKNRKVWKTKVDQLEKLREKSKKDNAALITKCEKALEAAKKKYDAKQKHFGDIDMDIKSREALIADCQKEIETIKEEMNDINESLKKMNADFEEAEKRFQDKKNVYDKAVAESQLWNEELNQITDQIQELNAAIHKIDLAKIKRGNEKEKLQGTVHYCEAELKKLEAEHRTVNFEKEEIPPNEKKSISEHKAEVDKLRKRYDELRERIDVEAAEQFETTKLSLANAEERLTRIEENKRELRKAMGQLDEAKYQLVVQAFEEVNTEFNKMMGTLLPDSAARLVKVNPNDLSQGLNIHVNLGGVWKESLSELSGGQKSLVALALVLSLCMFNPAPFYILDEIDSALDLNHTQNIGVLIKRKFTGTQFICVSLKDGMYSNCNILFQVQFLDGRSQVRRCVRNSNKQGNDEVAVVSSKLTKKFNKIVTGK